jgi:3-methyladenine DNA glycosylase AlkD
MPPIITKKSDVKIIANVLLDKLPYLNQNDFWEILDEEILQQKVRFPLLEYFANLLLEEIPYEEQIGFCDKIISLKREGGYVVVATVLKSRLNTDLMESFEKAVEYFIEGDEWYVCDIIGERVFGVGLLDHFEATFPYLEKIAEHENHWVKRSVGTATHLAVKWGLEKEKVSQLLDLALKYANTPFYQMKKGIGWGAKTIAKFHPDLIHERDILDNEEIGKWFLRKVKIGLNNPKSKFTRK